MPMTPQQQRALLRQIRDHKRALRTLERGFAGDVGKIAEDMYGRILSAVQGELGAVTEMSQAQMMSRVRAFIKSASNEAASLMEDHAAAITRRAAERSNETLALMTAGKLNPNIAEAARVFSHFEKMRSGGELLSAWGGREKYLAWWRETYGAGFDKTVRVLQDKFTRASLSGADWREVAKQITGTTGKLAAKDGVDPVVFAEAFARTKSTELANEASQRLGVAGGMELFINLGIPDEVQSEECFESCQAGAMTLQEWEAYVHGPPPRHFSGCRCELSPVPFDPEIDWKNPKFDED